MQITFTTPTMKDHQSISLPFTESINHLKEEYKKNRTLSFNCRANKITFNNSTRSSSSSSTGKNTPEHSQGKELNKRIKL